MPTTSARINAILHLLSVCLPADVSAAEMQSRAENTLRLLRCLTGDEVLLVRDDLLVRDSADHLSVAKALRGVHALYVQGRRDMLSGTGGSAWEVQDRTAASVLFAVEAAHASFRFGGEPALETVPRAALAFWRQHGRGQSLEYAKGHAVEHFLHEPSGTLPCAGEHLIWLGQNADRLAPHYREVSERGCAGRSVCEELLGSSVGAPAEGMLSP